MFDSETKPSTHVIMSKQDKMSVLILSVSSYLESPEVSSNAPILDDHCTDIVVLAKTTGSSENSLPCWKCKNEKSKKNVDTLVEYCDSPTECAGFYNGGKKGTFCLRQDDDTGINNCTLDSNSWDFNSKVVVCKDKGPKLKHSYFFGVFRGDREDLTVPAPPMYMDWTEADPKQMLYIHPLQRTNFYLSEEITITCEYSRYYFAIGSWFGVKHNQTIEYFSATDIKPCESDNDRIESNCTKTEFWRGTYKAEHTLLVNQTGQYEIFCFGPIWNSTEWVNTSMSFNVTIGQTPKVTSLQTQEKTRFQFGQKNRKLICNFTGKPVPEVKWTWTNVQAYPVIKRLGQYASELTFLEIGHNSEGVYTCKVKNSLGEHSKSFKIELGIQDWEILVILLMIVTYVLGNVFLHMFGVINGQKSRLEKFTRKDIQKFFKGNPQVLKKIGDKQFTTIAALEALPFDRRLEIPLKDLTIYTHLVLGEGAFGKVVKGKVNSAKVLERLKSAPGYAFVETLSNEIDVSVKIPQEDLNKAQMSTLLAEIKVAAHLGFHKNIVSLIGALTSKLAKSWNEFQTY